MEWEFKKEADRMETYSAPYLLMAYFDGRWAIYDEELGKEVAYGQVLGLVTPARKAAERWLRASPEDRKGLQSVL